VVEDMGIVVFLQDPDEKEVIQVSHFPFLAPL